MSFMRVFARFGRLCSFFGVLPLMSSLAVADETAIGQSPWIDGQAAVTARLVASQNPLIRGGHARIGIQFDIRPGWHIYAHQPGDAGYATQVELTSGEALFGPLLWPEAQTFREEDGVTTFGFSDQALLFTEATISDSASKTILVRAQARYLACNVTCSPGSVALARRFETAQTAPPQTKVGEEALLFHTAAAKSSREATSLASSTPPPQATHAFTPNASSEFQAQHASKLPQEEKEAFSMRALFEAVCLALVGGLILNLMPCVLPVLALKVVSLASHAHQPRRIGDALSYGAGVVGTLLALASTMLFLRGLGHEVGWGFQFQEPRFVILIAGVVLLFALNCFGVFEIVAPESAASSLSARRSGKIGQIAEGALAVVLATPCSAPFLGTATAFAVTAPAPWVLVIFASIGIGLALPYMLLVVSPQASRFVPKPGRWMLDLKNALGFALMATSLWLVWISGRQIGPDKVAALFALLWATSVGGALLGRVTATRMHLALPGLVFVVAMMGMGAWQIGAAPAPELNAPTGQTADAASFTPEALEVALSAGYPVLVDFTADWCITCKYNERHVLADPGVIAAMMQRRVKILRADFTRRDPEIARALEAAGRSGVPMYLLYDPKKSKQPRKLPEILTVPLLRGAICDLVP